MANMKRPFVMIAAFLAKVTCLIGIVLMPAQVSASHRQAISSSQAAPRSVVAAPLSKIAAMEAHMTEQPSKPKRLGVILFNGFETLDVFGPVQMWGRLPDYELVMISEDGGLVRSAQGFEVRSTHSFADAPQLDILMVPGGEGTRREVDNPRMLDFLRQQDRATEWTTSVCTGSAVLAKAGILRHRKATSNKLAWVWATSQSSEVDWQAKARWVVDGKFITSSGVSAGTDMALALVKHIYGREIAERIAQGAEYTWSDDPGNDPFAVNPDGPPTWMPRSH